MGRSVCMVFSALLVGVRAHGVFEEVDPGLLLERNEEVGLTDLHDYDGHWFMKPRLLSPRRNHDCVVHNGRIINMVGRFSPNIEALDLKTGQRTLMRDDPDLLGMNHPSVTTVAKVDGTGLEIWIPCGFIGSAVNEEESMTHATVIDADTLTASRGPELDRPRGACGSTALFLDGLDQPALVCIFGGSDGSHDAGEMLSIVSCYDRVRKSWRYLPPLPVAGDHLNVVQMAGGACDEGGDDQHQGSISPPRVLALHIRTENYGNARPEVYALDIDAETGAVVSNDWYVFATSGEHDVRDAAGVVVSEDSTALVSLGGISHGYNVAKERDWDEGVDHRTNAQQQVKVLDLCRREWQEEHMLLFTPRFAVQACKAGDAIFTCGGTFSKRSLSEDDQWIVQHHLHKQDSHTNLRTCEVFSETALLAELNRKRLLQ